MKVLELLQGLTQLEHKQIKWALTCIHEVSEKVLKSLTFNLLKPEFSFGLKRSMYFLISMNYSRGPKNVPRYKIRKIQDIYLTACSIVELYMSLQYIHIYGCSIYRLLYM